MTIKLTSRHLEDLRASGLSDDTIVAAGIFSASAKQVKKIIGFDAGPGLAFPYPGTDFVRIKPDTPWVHPSNLQAKSAKYLTKAGAGNRLYIPPDIKTTLKDPSIPIYITEGEKKTLKATQEGLNCIGLAGVWCWKGKNTRGESSPIPDLDLIKWNGRKVYIVFDSDIVEKISVKKAETALAEELIGRGAEVWAIRLPGGGNG